MTSITEAMKQHNNTFREGCRKKRGSSQLQRCSYWVPDLHMYRELYFNYDPNYQSPGPK